MRDMHGRLSDRSKIEVEHSTVGLSIPFEEGSGGSEGKARVVGLYDLSNVFDKVPHGRQAHGSYHRDEILAR